MLRRNIRIAQRIVVLNGRITRVAMVKRLRVCYERFFSSEHLLRHDLLPHGSGETDCLLFGAARLTQYFDASQEGIEGSLQLKLESVVPGVGVGQSSKVLLHRLEELICFRREDVLQLFSDEFLHGSLLSGMHSLVLHRQAHTGACAGMLLF